MSETKEDRQRRYKREHMRRKNGYYDRPRPEPLFCGKYVTYTRSHKFMYRTKYNLTLEEHDAILRAQDNKCAICECELDHTSGHACVDHCHTTGKIRGILCRLCNVGIGVFKEDRRRLLKALLYLKKS